jgi:hypothetical protein
MSRYPQGGARANGGAARSLHPTRCQSIEFFALFELRQNPGQQLLEYGDRAVTGQDLGIGNRRLDELADKLTKDRLAAISRANSGESTGLSLTGTVAMSPTPGARDSGRSSCALYATVVHAR